MKSPHDGAAAGVSKSRLEFLFDGIFAIAMTILVLEVKVPELADRRSVAELWRNIAHNGASYFSYFFSFGMLSLLWHRHNRAYHHFHHITGGMYVLNMVQLSLAAFFPFCAGTFGHNPFNYLAMALYIGCLFFYFICMTAVWKVARRAGAMMPELTPEEYRRQDRKNLRALIIFAFIFFGYFVTALANRAQ